MMTIIVIDEMAIVREPIAAVLRSQGHHVLCAAGGQESLSMIRIAHPQLVLFDLAISDMDGLQFLRALRADPLTHQTPVIVLTALSALKSRDRVVEAAKLGIGDFMIKSQFSLDDLLARVRRCVEATTTTEAGRQIIQLRTPVKTTRLADTVSALSVGEGAGLAADFPTKDSTPFGPNPRLKP